MISAKFGRYALLDELRRFRRFKRSYYDFEYDWARLDYLKSVYERLLPGCEESSDRAGRVSSHNAAAFSPAINGRSQS